MAVILVGKLQTSPGPGNWNFVTEGNGICPACRKRRTIGVLERHGGDQSSLDGRVCLPCVKAHIAGIQPAFTDSERGLFGTAV